MLFPLSSVLNYCLGGYALRLFSGLLFLGF